MNNEPLTTASNGRDGSGRFGPGNKAATGNPFAKRVARLRAALFKSVTPADLKAVIAALLAQARAGDVPSAKELLQRLLGPPVEADIAERLAELERSITELQKRGTS